MKDSIDTRTTRTNVVGNSGNLTTESNKTLIHRDNALKKVYLTFKRGFIILKPAKNSAVILLPLDSVSCRRSVNLKRQTGRRDRRHETFRRLRFAGNEGKPNS